MTTLYLPKDVRELTSSNEHPGLQLDKFSCAGKQDEQKNALNDVLKVFQKKGDRSCVDAARNRRKEALDALGASRFAARTVGPLTLHLSRATALENAGICLHPLYGFVYLPGSGLKGMARAFAETVWLPQQTDQPTAWERIEDVFGWAPNPDRKKQIKERDHPAHQRFETIAGEDREIQSHVGAVVFHDAWPREWPKLIIDIVNNHHKNYYDGQDAPGDWEEPSPVYFLAVGPGCTFDFALSKRSPDTSEGDVELARQWLVGALTHLGAGAKTNAGYGSFEVVDADKQTDRAKTEARRVWRGELIQNKRAYLEEVVTLELVTPAFLAGANQNRDDCDLRPATLRGLLRWWWRTMHSGYVDVATLREMESAIWGNTKAGGAVRVEVRPAQSKVNPNPYDRPKIIAQRKLPRPAERKTTQGLTYFSFGMDDDRKDDETGNKMHVRRHYADAGARWTVVLSARAAGKANSSETLTQGLAALWLLCRYGGVGGKSRKGFGSFADVELNSIKTVDDCKKAAERFRRAWGADCRFVERYAKSPSLAQILPELTIPAAQTDPWRVLDAIGSSAQAFAKKYAHRPEKKALGLPRNVKGLGDFQPAIPNVKNRHASPVFYHVGKAPNGRLEVRVAAFPAQGLPSLEKSRKFLEELRKHLEQDLKNRIGQAAGPAATGSGGSKAPMLDTTAVAEATDIEVMGTVKKRNDRWIAKYPGGEAMIENSNDVPPSVKPNQRVRLLVRGRKVFWPTNSGTGSER